MTVLKAIQLTNVGNDIFAKLLAASQNGITDTETVPVREHMGRTLMSTILMKMHCRT